MLWPCQSSSDDLLFTESKPSRFHLPGIIVDVYDWVITTLLSTFGMMMNDGNDGEEVDERTVAIPSHRIRGWYLIFGALWFIFSVVLLIDPEGTLSKMGWIEVDGVLSRLLAMILLINGAVFFTLANPYVFHFYSIMSMSATGICLSFAIAIIVVSIEADEGFRKFNIFMISILIIMACIWMYCKGFTNAINQNSHMI